MREFIYFALLDLKREVSELKQLVQGRPAEVTPRPIYEVDDRLTTAEIVSSDGPGQDGESMVLEADRTLKELEREAIERALNQVGGNRRRAAEFLGIGVRTLYRKLDEYGLK